jgi:hypothetical protein
MISTIAHECFPDLGVSLYWSKLPTCTWGTLTLSTTRTPHTSVLSNLLSLKAALQWSHQSHQRPCQYPICRLQRTADIRHPRHFLTFTCLQSPFFEQPNCSHRLDPICWALPSKKTSEGLGMWLCRTQTTIVLKEHRPVMFLFHAFAFTRPPICASHRTHSVTKAEVGCSIIFTTSNETHAHQSVTAKSIFWDSSASKRINSQSKSTQMLWAIAATLSDVPTEGELFRLFHHGESFDQKWSRLCVSVILLEKKIRGWNRGLEFVTTAGRTGKHSQFSPWVSTVRTPILNIAGLPNVHYINVGTEIHPSYRSCAIIRFVHVDYDVFYIIHHTI